MRIKTKTNSPTVIVVEQGTMDEDKNSLAFKRMDLLEREMDKKFKSITDKKDFVRLIDKMQNSFVTSLNKLVSANKSTLTDVHNKRIVSLRSEFKSKIDTLKRSNTDSALLKSFASKLNSLESSIKNISTEKPQVKIVNRNSGLDKALDNWFFKMQELIKKVGPRMIPSPS